MSQLCIHTDRLRNHMVIARDIHSRCGGGDAILVPEGTVVDKEVSAILARNFIEYVYIESEEKKEGPVSVCHSKNSEHFREFEKKFEIVQEDISSRLDDIVFRDKNIDVDGLLKMLNEVVEQADSSSDLCDMLHYMKENSSGVYTHSINTALIGQLLSKWMGLTGEETEVINLCGLLHDIGKLRLPGEILGKKELTKKEAVLLEKHSILSYNILKDKDVDYRVKQAVLTHHERIDGSGYPLKVTGPNITKYSRILAVADTYDIMTSAQPDREALCPFDVVHTFETEGYNKFDPSVLMVFLSNILTHFIHHKVLLSDGRIGEVVFINRTDLSRPLVRCGGVFEDLSLRRNISVVKMAPDDGV